VIEKISGLDKIAKLPYVVYSRQIIEEGTVIPATGDIAQRVAAIGVYVKDKKKINYIDKKT